MSNDKLESIKSIIMLVQHDITNPDGSLPEEHLVNALDLALSLIDSMIE